MHDFSLGPPIDVGQYDGPLLDGRPLHNGNCEDGVYGCRMCNSAARHLTNEQLEAIGWPTTGSCDWCNKVVPTKELDGIRPHDEPSCYYEVCNSCYSAHQKELRELADEDDDY